MAIILARATEPRQGEIIEAFPDDHLFSGKELPESGLFWHIKITDRNLAQATAYLQSWSHDADVQQIAATGNDRTIQVTTTMVSVSGKGAFEASEVDDLMTRINTEHPTANATRIDLTNTSFTFTITAPAAARDEIVFLVNRAVRRWTYDSRRWYVNQAGRTYLSNNGGYAEGTASQVSNYLRDGLLD